MSDNTEDEVKLFALVEQALELEESARQRFIESQTPDMPELRARACAMLANIEQDDKDALVTGQGAHYLLNWSQPKRIGNYNIINEIGRGGMGVVYRAQRTNADFEHEVALKLVSVKNTSNKFIERLRSERRLLAQLKHPNIAQFYDGGETQEGMPFFVMEFVDGKPLHHYLENADKSLTQRLGLFQQICAAISYAHTNTIIHRDLSPSNILINKDNIVKVIDFGISSSLDEELAHSTYGMTRTEGYAAPERLSSDVVSTVGDVYSLGVILSDMTKNISTSRQFELDAIISKATQKNQDERYQSVDTLHNDIQSILLKQPVLAVNGGSSYRLRCFIRANKLAVGASTVFVLCLIIAAIIFASLFFRALTAEASANDRFNDVRSLANFMMFEHYDTVSSLPSSTQARVELAQKAQSYLDQLNKFENAPFALQVETAAGYRRLGDVYGNPIVPNLGKRADAERILLAALETLNHLYQSYTGDPKLILALADAHYSLSGFNLIVLDNVEDAYEHAKQAELLYRKYTQMITASDVVYRQVSSALRMQSNALVWAQKGEEAIEAARIAQQYINDRLITMPESIVLQKELSEVLTTLGYNTALHQDNLQSTDYSDAFEIMQRGVAMARKLLLSQSDNRQFEASLALNLLRLGTMYYSIDQETVAMTFLDEAKQIVERLLIIDPRDEELRRRLNSILKQSSITVAYLSQFSEAYLLSDQYIDNQQRLVEEEPDNSGYHRELANGYGMRGEIARLEGDLGKACNWFLKADELYENVIVQFQIDPRVTDTERRFIKDGLEQCTSN